MLGPILLVAKPNLQTDYTIALRQRLDPTAGLESLHCISIQCTIKCVSYPRDAEVIIQLPDAK